MQKVFRIDAHWFELWNTLEPSLALMYQRQVDLGWAYYNEEIRVEEPQTEESQYHTD